jgi:hypothetical protein
MLAALQPGDEVGDRRRLVAGRFIVANQLEALAALRLFGPGRAMRLPQADMSATPGVLGGAERGMNAKVGSIMLRR